MDQGVQRGFGKVSLSRIQQHLIRSPWTALSGTQSCTSWKILQARLSSSGAQDDRTSLGLSSLVLQVSCNDKSACC